MSRQHCRWCCSGSGSGSGSDSGSSDIDGRDVPPLEMQLYGSGDGRQFLTRSFTHHGDIHRRSRKGKNRDGARHDAEINRKDKRRRRGKKASSGRVDEKRTTRRDRDRGQQKGRTAYRGVAHSLDLNRGRHDRAAAAVDRNFRLSSGDDEGGDDQVREQQQQQQSALADQQGAVSSSVATPAGAVVVVEGGTPRGVADAQAGVRVPAQELPTLYESLTLGLAVREWAEVYHLCRRRRSVQEMVLHSVQGVVRDHLLVCGPASANRLCDFLAPLRSRKLSREAMPAVVVLSELPPQDSDEWRLYAWFDRLYFVNGNALHSTDLKRAGASVAARAVIITSHCSGGSSPDQQQHLGGQALSADSATVFIMQTLITRFGMLITQIFAEFQHGDNMSFVPNIGESICCSPPTPKAKKAVTRVLRGREKPPEHTAYRTRAFAAGYCWTNTYLYSVASYLDSAVPVARTLQLLCGAPRYPGQLQATSHLYQTALPEDAPPTYGELLARLLKESSLVCVGLYRRLGEEDAHVMTNPPPELPLRSSDLVFVLGGADQRRTAYSAAFSSKPRATATAQGTDPAVDQAHTQAPAQTQMQASSVAVGGAFGGSSGGAGAGGDASARRGSSPKRGGVIPPLADNSDSCITDPATRRLTPTPVEQQHPPSQRPPSHEQPQRRTSHEQSQQPSLQQSLQPSHQQPSHQQPSHQQPSHQQPSHQQPSHQQPSHQQPQETVAPVVLGVGPVLAVGNHLQQQRRGPLALEEPMDLELSIAPQRTASSETDDVEEPLLGSSTRSLSSQQEP